MDTNLITEDAMLVNFRAPRSVIETLDQLSRFHHRTRTAVLIDLITDWINERTCDIPLKVRQLKVLKSALNSHEQSTSEDSRSIGTGPIETMARNRSELIPAVFYSSPTNDLNNGGNDRF